MTWGSDSFGQSSPPYSKLGAVAVAAGIRHSAAVRVDGSVYCWGWNFYGQCNVPAGLRAAKRVAAGYGHTLILDHFGNVTVWGSNDFGLVSQASQIGLASDVDSGSFTAIATVAPCSETNAGPAICACGPFQIDWNEDGIADCVARQYGDLDLDGSIGAGDLSLLLDNWSNDNAPMGDLDQDGAVGASDLSLLLVRWGHDVG